MHTFRTVKTIVFPRNKFFFNDLFFQQTVKFELWSYSAHARTKRYCTRKLGIFRDIIRVELCKTCSGPALVTRQMNGNNKLELQSSWHSQRRSSTTRDRKNTRRAYQLITISHLKGWFWNVHKKFPFPIS